MEGCDYQVLVRTVGREEMMIGLDLRGSKVGWALLHWNEGHRFLFCGRVGK